MRLTLRCSQEAHGQRATAAGGAAEEAEVNHGGGGFTSKEKNEDLSMRFFFSPRSASESEMMPK